MNTYEVYLSGSQQRGEHMTKPVHRIDYGDIDDMCYIVYAYFQIKFLKTMNVF